MDTDALNSIHDSKRSTDTGTNITLPRPLKVIYSVHRYFRWCLQSPIVPGTHWTGIACHISLTHIHRTSTNMEHLKQEAYGVYYSITKCNYYLQGFALVVRNDHKPLQMFINGKNANNKVNHLSLELATYNITLEWISGACNKTMDCLSSLVEVPENDTTDSSILINAVKASPTETHHLHLQQNQCSSNSAIR